MTFPLPDKPNAALLVIGHGASSDPHSGAPTRAHTAAIAAMGRFGRVTAAFWKEEPGIHTALAAIPEREIYVVPNFISEGYYTRTVIPRELGIPTGEPGSHMLPDGRVLHYCAPTGSHPMMTELLLRRAREVAPEETLSEAALIIVGHGTERHRNSALAARQQVEAIRTMGIFAEVSPAYIDEAPQIRQWREQTRRETVIVVPFFIADGMHSFSDIPRMLGIPRSESGAESRAAIFARNPYPIEGRRLYYASAIGTEAGFAQVILDQVAQREGSLC